MKKITKILVIILIIIIFMVPFLALAAPSNEQTERTRSQEKERREARETEDPQKIGDYVRERTKNIKNENAAERAKTKAEVTLKVQERLKAVIERAIKRYERVKIQVQNSNLTEEEKQRVTLKLDEQIAKLNIMLVEAEGIKNIVELRAVMQRVRTDFKISLGLVRQSLTGVLEARLNRVVEKLEATHTRLSEQVVALPEGVQKEELVLTLEEVKAQVDIAKESIKTGDFFTAREKLGQARELMLEVVKSIEEINQQGV